MEFYIFLLVMGALIIFSQNIRFFFKRIILIAKLNTLCRKNNAKLHFVNPFSLFSGIKVKHCDLYIETQYEILSIKLFGLGYKPYYVTFMPERKYTVTRFVIIPGARGIYKQPITGKKNEFPNYKFDYKFKSEWKFKTFRKILLINPISMDYMVARDNSHGYLCNGDIIYGMEAFSYTGLKKIMERQM